MFLLMVHLLVKALNKFKTYPLKIYKLFWLWVVTQKTKRAILFGGTFCIHLIGCNEILPSVLHLSGYIYIYDIFRPDVCMYVSHIS